MSLIVNVHGAETQFSRLLEQAHAGQEIIVAKAGKTYARLVPLAPGKGQREPGRLRGRVTEEFFETIPDEELAAWERNARDFCSTRTLFFGG